MELYMVVFSNEIALFSIVPNNIGISFLFVWESNEPLRIYTIGGHTVIKLHHVLYNYL